MPGNFKTVVVFPFEFDGAKSARIQIEPFVCVHCYGISVKVILELTSGSGNNTYTFERVAHDDALTQENIRDGFMSAPFVEVMEGFYYNKTEANVLVPVCAMLMKIYFSDLLDAFGVNLDGYVMEVEYAKEALGFKAKANDNVSNKPANKSNYKEEPAVSPYSSRGDDEAKNKVTCKQIVKSLCQKSKGFKVRS
jgi:hypothetical protein